LRAALGLITLRSPFWNRSGKHRFGRLLLCLSLAYVTVLVVLLFLEDWLLFASTDGSDWSHPPKNGCVVEDVWFTSADGTRLHAWWLTEPGWEPGHGALLHCHGNGGNLSYRGGSVDFWLKRQRLAVLLFDYPGYGKSGGKSSEAGCYAAADAAYAWLTEEQRVPAGRIILYGGSLGGAVAVDLAARRPHRALVLVSTFTTLPDIAQAQYPFLPARWLVRNRFNSLAKIRQVDRPVFVTHSDADGLIPCAMGQRLFEAANEPKKFFIMQGEPHHDAGSTEAFAAFAEFVRKHAP
jgi:fermentation-respiration switch protein FrsA (DUF1100 family)